MKRNLWPGAVVACILLIAVFIVINLNTTQAQASQTPPGLSPLSSQPLVRPVQKSFGVPAIVVQGTKQQNAHIQISDVKAYLKTHPFPGGPAVAGVSPKLTTIDYTTSGEASKKINDTTIGLADNAPVYYVEWQGPFDLSKVNVPYGAAPLKSAAKGVEIFDAQTGNILLWWVPNN